MEVVILGSGNVAHVLGRKIMAAGHSVCQVLSRHLPSGLAQELAAEAITDFTRLTTGAALYVVAVNDAAVPLIAAQFPKVAGIIAHTAGALPLSVLAQTGKRHGVLYPLQSLRKEKQDYEVIPLLTDGNDPEVQATLTAFARSISSKVALANDEHRLKLHTAAVVVSNFTNHLYALAHDFCQKEKTDFSLLQPLIEETALRMQQFLPEQMQTGPAIRNDAATITRHLHVLQPYPQLQHLYQVLTQSIQQLTVDNG